MECVDEAVDTTVDRIVWRAGVDVAFHIAASSFEQRFGHQLLACGEVAVRGAAGGLGGVGDLRDGWGATLLEEGQRRSHEVSTGARLLLLPGHVLPRPLDDLDVATYCHTCVGTSRM